VSGTAEGEKYSGWSLICFLGFRPGIRFYLYIFCVTLANVLITMLLPVRDPRSPVFRDTSDRVVRPG